MTGLVKDAKSIARRDSLRARRFEATKSIDRTRWKNVVEFEMSRLCCTAAWRTLTYGSVSQPTTSASPFRKIRRKLTHLQVNLVRLRVRVYLRHDIVCRLEVIPPDEYAC